MAYSLDHFAAGSTPGAPANTDDAVIVSSGNVFADLGFENPAEERLKADLVIGIGQEIARRRLSQSAAARLLGISQPDVSKLLRGRTGGYSLERLFALMSALGRDIEVTVRAPEPARQGHVHLRMMETA